MNLTFDNIKKELIGEYTTFNTPYGERIMTYGDYTASGRSLHFIEEYMNQLQKLYANSHTEDSITGLTMTELLHKAEKKIKDMFNAKDHYIIPTNSGATGAIVKLSEILGIYMEPALRSKIEDYIAQSNEINNLNEMFKNNRPVVFVGPYEHHSNELIWKESIAEVVVIDLSEDGKIDIEDLKNKIANPEYADRVKFGSFSASSNITGIKSDIYEIAKVMHANGGYVAFDFAASGPYVEIDMYRDDESHFDAVYLSPHKFIGGPGSSGILLISKKLYNHDLPPTVAGGGTVDYVSSFGYEFTADVETREKAGTPGILQVIRAALAVEIKEELGIKNIEEIEHKYMKRVFDRLNKNDKVDILGSHDPAARVSIMSFNIRHGEGYLNPRFIARVFNDLFGLQSRAGCSCAGPYGHRLLNIDRTTSEKYRVVVKNGTISLKPGWLRVNFHFTMTEAEVDFIMDAIEFIAESGYLFLDEYKIDIHSGLWSHMTYKEDLSLVDNFGIKASLDFIGKDVEREYEDKEVLYKNYLDEAKKIADNLKENFTENYASFPKDEENELKWFEFKHRA
jgi:selenocysteine lyase/cysteine desulfurase